MQTPSLCLWLEAWPNLKSIFLASLDCQNSGSRPTFSCYSSFKRDRTCATHNSFSLNKTCATTENDREESHSCDENVVDFHYRFYHNNFWEQLNINVEQQFKELRTDLMWLSTV
ncbi:hypothetical protein ACJX0J_014772, partial [Zea mays]